MSAVVEPDPPPCRCTHPLADHEHYRAGEDCGRCGCPRYRRRPGALLRALERVCFDVALLAGLVRDIGRRPR